ncbi:unnamed protein product [Mycena citricolor]|uniref:Uncharacterized protein n=1 Tax=Mycena citricolor TaxID=2018698 RepID=A0AAD2K3P9_9AGAR|nr:unnamed protein product [Mycena citricolor]
MPRNDFLPEEEDRLVEYLAGIPRSKRSSMSSFAPLSTLSWAKRHSTASWLQRFLRLRTLYDARIDRLVAENEREDLEHELVRQELLPQQAKEGVVAFGDSVTQAEDDAEAYGGVMLEVENLLMGANESSHAQSAKLSLDPDPDFSRSFMELTIVDDTLPRPDSNLRSGVLDSYTTAPPISRYAIFSALPSCDTIPCIQIAANLLADIYDVDIQVVLDLWRETSSIRKTQQHLSALRDWSTA